MDTRTAYNIWAEQYDTNSNRTRDLEGVALRDVLAERRFERSLEIGCGTGKNTVWLRQHSMHLTAVDLSEEMLQKARQKVTASNVRFYQADMTAEEWAFANGHYDLITFSLVLEHIKDVTSVFKRAVSFLKPSGRLYIGELHPFKQYLGTQARFDTAEGRHVVQCFNHHVSEFTDAAQNTGLSIETFKEFFDDDSLTGVPRILSILFRKA